LPRIPHRSTPTLIELLSSRWARFSTLMVGTQQVWENNDM
jgi:hypothetical protein